MSDEQIAEKLTQALDLITNLCRDGREGKVPDSGQLEYGEQMVEAYRDHQATLPFKDENGPRVGTTCRPVGYQGNKVWRVVKVYERADELDVLRIQIKAGEGDLFDRTIGEFRREWEPFIPHPGPRENERMRSEMFGSPPPDQTVDELPNSWEARRRMLNEVSEFLIYAGWIPWDGDTPELLEWDERLSAASLQLARYFCPLEDTGTEELGDASDLKLPKNLTIIEKTGPGPRTMRGQAVCQCGHVDLLHLGPGEPRACDSCDCSEFRADSRPEASDEGADRNV